jgi:hypothetical protein
VYAALLGLAFEPDSGELASTGSRPDAAHDGPISLCPFDASEVTNGGVALARRSGQSDQREFAVLTSGTLYFWSSSR